MALAGEMLALGGLAPGAAAGRSRAEAVLDDGRATETFARMVCALGGPKDFVDRPDRYLARAPVVKPCLSERDGFVVGMEARQIGLAVVTLGGGRQHADDAVDPSVGITDVIDIGAPIRAGEELCRVHAATEADADAAIAALQSSIRIGETSPPERPVVIGRVIQ